MTDYEQGLKLDAGERSPWVAHWLTQSREHRAALLTCSNRMEPSAVCTFLGFRLLFDFAENKSFTNETLSKTYQYEIGDDNAGLFYGDIIGDTIYWKPGRELPYQWDGRKISVQVPLAGHTLADFNCVKP